jgi:hypothetical protein
VQTTLDSSFGNKYDFAGSKHTSPLYFSGIFHSYSSGIRASFFILSFCLLDTPVNVGGKNNLELFPKES